MRQKFGQSMFDKYHLSAFLSRSWPFQYPDLETGNLLQSGHCEPCNVHGNPAIKGKIEKGEFVSGASQRLFLNEKVSPCLQFKRMFAPGFFCNMLVVGSLKESMEPQEGFLARAVWVPYQVGKRLGLEGVGDSNARCAPHREARVVTREKLPQQRRMP